MEINEANTINYVKICFSLITSATILTGSIYNCFESYLPKYFLEFVRYGKLSGKKRNFMEVPKSWFKHFYVFAFALSIFVLFLATNVYILKKESPWALLYFYDQTIGALRTSTVSPACVLLALFLLFLQCTRRFYETHYVSVFSNKAKMNIAYYFIGYLHYFGTYSAILGEAPGFVAQNEQTIQLKLSDIKWYQVIAALIFIWAWYCQYKANVILANLRKNKEGQVVTETYKLPRGGLFEYVTSPHLFAEKLMYLCLTIILWGNTTFLFVLAWVLANQIQTAFLSYWWYKKKFDDFPNNRKAVIPFIY